MLPITVQQSQRPSSLKISEPKPVPLPSNVRRAIKPTTSLPQKSSLNAIPRSQPISMKRSDQRNSNDLTNVNSTAATAPSAINISSISPPAVQFAIGSPPIGSRRSVSGGSLSESPPVAPYLWQISPTAQQSPPIRQSSSTQLLQQGNLNGSSVYIPNLSFRNQFLNELKTLKKLNLKLRYR